MAKVSKRVELLILMDKAGLIDVPVKTNSFAMKFMRNHELDNKEKLIAALTDCQYGKSKLLQASGVGPVTVAEMCLWAVYGNNEQIDETR